MAQVVGNWGGGNIWCITSDEFSSNSYYCDVKAEGGVLIDSGLDGEAIDEVLSLHGFRPRWVFCTHGHFDHIGGASHFQRKYGSQVFLHKADERTMKASNFLLMAIKIPHKVRLPEVTYVQNDFTYNIASHNLRYLPAPGHTPGSCIIEFGNAWFTGDTIYSRGVGLSSMPGEDHKLISESILGHWDGVKEGCLICPGHGPVADGGIVRRENLPLLKFLGIN